ncbi:MAG: cupin domain-containing protein [Acidimicrobiia bacterium]|nr:cupin domain-containing protein [Acidimicrobiia bacterium]MDH4307093.1 cupin domain-containing protein [Acidimicrobiia bacterium]MDH5294407.1 cupin domain-containing protein [Acidimicrobiia bacterium]
MPSVFRFDELPRSHSTRDGRLRYDLITEEMFGFADIKADHITYNPGDTAAAHYHIGAKHFFFVDQGAGVLHIDDRRYELHKGDVAFVDEREAHWFENPSDDVFSFYELWVPTPGETVWVVDDDR